MSKDYGGFFDYETIREGHSFLPEHYASLFNITDGESEIPQRRIVVIFHVVLNVAGCVGNALICYVIVNNKHMHTTINFYLLSQAISDTVSFSSFSFIAIYCMHISSYHGDYYVNIITGISEFFHFMGMRASVLVKIAIALDRYIAVCYPLLQLKRRHRTIKIIIGIWIFSSLSTTSYIVCSIYPSLDSTWFSIFFSFEITLAIFVFIPMFVIAVLYILIGFHIWQSSRIFKHSMNRSDSKTGNKTNRRGLDISVAIILEYVVCWLPITLIFMLYKYKLIDMSRVVRNRTCLLVSIAMYSISAIINPILYSVMCMKFRNAFKSYTVLCGKQTLCEEKKDYYPLKDLLYCTSYKCCNGSETQTKDISMEPHDVG